MSNKCLRRSQAPKALKELFDTTRIEVVELLEAYVLEHPSRKQIYHVDTLEPAVLYLIDGVLRDRLVSIAKAYDAQIDEPWYKSYGFHRVCRFVNPDECVGNYSVQTEVKFKHVSDPDRVLEMLEGEHARFENVYRKYAMKSYLAKGDRSEEEVAAFSREISSTIAKAKSDHERLMNDPEAYEIHIISKERAKTSHNLFYRQEDTQGKRKQVKRHLLTTTPNVLWYKRGSRSDMRVGDIIEIAKREGIHFGDVYAIALEG
jgi:hypothetical protein